MTKIIVGAFGVNFDTSSPKAYSDRITRLDLGNVENVGDHAFGQCKNLSVITFGDRLKYLDQHSFTSCPSLKSVTIPKTKNSLYLGYHVFSHVDLPEKIIFLCDENTTFDNNFLALCDSSPCGGKNVQDIYVLNQSFLDKIIGKFDIPSSSYHKVKTIGVEDEFLVWQNNDSTKLIGLSDSVNDKTELIIPNDINSIDKYSFQNYSENLKYINFPSGTNVTSIDPQAFAGVPDTTKYRVNVNDKTSSTLNALKYVLGGSAFQKLSTYRDDGDFFIQDFSGSTEPSELVNLTQNAKSKDKLFVPNYVSTIGSDAFKNCSPNLKSITFENEINLASIEQSAFNSVPSSTVFYVSDEASARDLRSKSNIDPERIYYPSVNTNFVLHKNLKNNRVELTGLTADGKKATNLTIGDVNLVLPNAFYGSSPNLKKIIFQNESTGFDPDALKNLGNHVVYYVDSENVECSTITGLKQQGNVDVTRIYLQKKDEGDFSVRGRLDGQEKVLVNLSNNGLTKTELTIPSDINRIDSEAFNNVTNLINKITFNPNTKLSYIGSETFKNEKLKNTQYIFNPSDISTAKLLNQNGVSDNQIILSNDQYDISINGILVQIKNKNSSKNKETSLVIPKKINGIDVTGIGINAFKNYLDVKQFEFSDGIVLDKNKIDPNVFSKFDASKILLYVYNSASASALSEVSSLTVGIVNGDFFNEYHNQKKLIGLSASGRKQTKLEIPANVTELNSYTFLGCSNNLSKITVDGVNITLADDVFSSIPSETLKNIQFYVVNQRVKDAIKSKHIDERNIHFFTPPSNKISYKTIGIIVGSICLAIILLGLGIGLPMRKQNKINVLNAKLTHKRIDKLSTANAMAFKKVVEATGNLGKQMQLMTTDIRALKAASVPKVIKKVDVKSPVNKVTPKTPSTTKPPVSPTKATAPTKVDVKSSTNPTKLNSSKPGIRPTTIKTQISSKPPVKK